MKRYVCEPCRRSGDAVFFLITSKGRDELNHHFKVKHRRLKTRIL